MEIEVFRLTPEIGKCYEYAECTRIEGKYPNERYYTTNKLSLVGKFINHESIGYRDNAQHWDVFENAIIHYSYEGNTCFREINTSEWF
jgi:hypothetical protein